MTTKDNNIPPDMLNSITCGDSAQLMSRIADACVDLVVTSPPYDNLRDYNNGKGFATKDEIAYRHPAIFPEKLAADHILSWSNVGDVVLDPFCGSGTVPKMAKSLDRKYIGIEISPDYCDIARKRLASISLQMTLNI